MPEQPAEQPTPPADHFTTRDGRTIGFKPWTLSFLGGHIREVTAFVRAMADLALGERVNVAALEQAVPALRASLQDPDMLDHVHGLSEMAEFCRAVWAYNEVSEGLGKFVAFNHDLTRGIVADSSGLLGLPE